MVLAPAVLPTLKYDHSSLFLDQGPQVRALRFATDVPTEGLARV